MSEQQYKTVDKFDRVMGELTKLPDVTHTAPSTVVSTRPLIGATQTFIIQTYRQIQRDGDDSKTEDTLFIQYIDDQGSSRFIIPHKAIQAILRQHDALGTKVRRKIGREQAQARKARGELPGFMRKKKAKSHPNSQPKKED